MFCGIGATRKRKKKLPEIVVNAPHEGFSLGSSAEVREPKWLTVKRFFRSLPDRLHGWLHGFVLSYFRTVNRKARKRMNFFAMKMETFEHVDSVVKVFTWVILPVSFVYALVVFWLLGETALDSVLLGVLLFFYSNFLPDIPAIFRRKNLIALGIADKGLPWYKNCALLLFAPLFVGLFLCGLQVKWRTIETFHNFRSMAIYVAFLFMIGFFVFSSFPFGVGDVAESLSVPFYGLAGYLTHLKIDLVF